MKEFSNKTPYLAPQLTVVEFKVERGYADSDLEFTTGAKGQLNPEDLNEMLFGGKQNNTNSYMGSSMGYFSSGSYFGDGFGDDLAGGF